MMTNAPAPERRHTRGDGRGLEARSSVGGGERRASS